MKLPYFLFVFLFSSFFCFSQTEYQQHAVEILPGSKLEISGDTNINEFNCVFNSDLILGERKIQYKAEEEKIYFKESTLILVNSGFNCRKKAINRDFHELLKTEEFPEISIKLEEIKLINEKLAEAKVIIRIAGKSKSYRFTVEIQKTADLNIKGSWPLNIRDFSLDPPHKLWGLIIVKDDIRVNFSLKIGNLVKGE